jgi:hypothetical protein
MPRETLEQKRKRARRIITTLNRTHPDAKLALNFSNPLYPHKTKPRGTEKHRTR